MASCVKKTTGAYGARYLKRAETLARSIRRENGRRRELIDGCILEGKSSASNLTALCIELPARIALEPRGFVPYLSKDKGRSFDNFLFATREGYRVIRSDYDPIPASGAPLTQRSVNSTSWISRKTMLALGGPLPREPEPTFTRASSNIGENTMLAPTAITKQKHWLYKAQLITNAWDDTETWLVVQRCDQYGENAQFFSVKDSYLPSVTNGYTWFHDSAAIYSSMRVIEIDRYEFAVVFTAQKKILDLPGLGYRPDSKLIMWRISTEDPDSIRSTFHPFPENIYPEGMRDPVAYKDNAAYLSVDLLDVEHIVKYDVPVGVMRIDDIELDDLGNILVALKLFSTVPNTEDPNSQLLYNTISFGRATWGNVQSGGAASSFVEHSRDIDLSAAMVGFSDYEYDHGRHMMGDRQIFVNGDIYRWGIPAPRRGIGVDATLPTSLQPYIVELKNGVPTGYTGEDEGMPLLAFGVAMEADDLNYEIVYFDRDYNERTGLNALRNRFNRTSKDFARDTMCGEKDYVSDTCVVFPGGGVIEPYGEYPTYVFNSAGDQVPVVGALAFKSSSVGLTFIDGPDRKYEKIRDAEPWSPYGEIGADLQNSIAFQNGYIMYVHCFQQEVRNDKGELMCPSAILITLCQPKETARDDRPTARFFVRCGPIWPGDEVPREDGQPTDPSTYYREINEAAIGLTPTGTDGVSTLYTGQNSKAFFQGWPFPLRDNNHLFMAGKKTP